MEIITANELKIKGIASIQARLAQEQEVAITVRGKKSMWSWRQATINTCGNVNWKQLCLRRRQISKAIISLMKA